MKAQQPWPVVTLKYLRYTRVYLEDSEQFAWSAAIHVRSGERRGWEARRDTKCVARRLTTRQNEIWEGDNTVGSKWKWRTEIAMSAPSPPGWRQDTVRELNEVDGYGSKAWVTPGESGMPVSASDTWCAIVTQVQLTWKRTLDRMSDWWQIHTLGPGHLSPLSKGNEITKNGK